MDNDEVCAGCGKETKLIYCDDCGSPYCKDCRKDPEAHICELDSDGYEN